jgi:PIN domain nuclease of toxin-antitoxin system
VVHRIRLLADTRVLLWWLADAKELSGRHRELLADPLNYVAFSAISMAEISIKRALGKLDAPASVAACLREGGLADLPFTAAHAEALGELPHIDRDPFDRMLIAQAQVEGMTLATVDPAFQSYQVTTI